MGIVFAVIWGAIKLVFKLLWMGVKIVYHILKFLRVRLLVFYLLVCGVFQLFGGVLTGHALLFWMGTLACALITIFGWLNFFFKLDKRSRAERKKAREERARKREEKRKNKEMRRQESAISSTQTEDAEAPRAPAVEEGRASNGYPKYFNVEGKPDYMFAEYADRYELFKRDGSGWKHIRTDKK